MLFTSFQVLTCADSTINGLTDNCSNVEHLFFIHNLTVNDVNTHEFRLNLVRLSTRKIDYSKTGEAYHIKEKCPILNNVVKASREMQLFSMRFTYSVYKNHFFYLFPFILEFSDYNFTFYNSVFLNWNFIYVLKMIS